MKEEGVYVIAEFIEQCLIELVDRGDGVVENCRTAGNPQLVEEYVQK